MTRCARFAGAWLAAASLALALALPAAAQTHRPFPPDALRGELVVVQPPEVRLNGQPQRLSPGARIRGETNLLVLSGSVVEQKLLVHYTLDPQGQLRDVWVLNEAERANRVWPRTPQEAAAMVFEPATQTWSRR